MWASEVRAQALLPYRGAKRERGEWGDSAVDEALELLSENRHDVLARKKARHVKGPLTWARIADGAVRTLTADLVGAGSGEDLQDAIARVQELHARMEARDASKLGRITREVRDGVVGLYGVASVLEEMAAVRDGKAPSFETAGRAASLRGRWNRLGGGANAVVRQLVEACVAHVLTSSATDGMKALYSRALSHWLPVSPAPQEPKGERISFDDDDF